jgi:anti-sigma regulatory factor (Ser/Thr protein kinase)
VPEAEIELAADAASVAAARRFVAEFLRGVGDDDDSWAAVQLVSELSTNAIVHAGTPFVVRVAVSDELVRIEVSDRNPALRAVQRHFSDDATTGRGLGMIEMLARSWGVEPRAGAKTVWCELMRSATGDQPDDDRPESTRHTTAARSAPPIQGRSTRDASSPSVQLRAA